MLNMSKPTVSKDISQALQTQSNADNARSDDQQKLKQLKLLFIMTRHTKDLRI